MLKTFAFNLNLLWVERRLNQSPGKEGCWSLETIVLGAAVGSSCMPLWTGTCRSTCLARAFAALPWNCSSSKPAISHTNEQDFWVQGILECQHQRTLVLVSWSGRDWSELWARKPKHACTPSHSCLASLDRDLSAVKAILVCWHVLTSDISWGLFSLTPLGKRPHGTSKLQGWGCGGCWVPTMLEEVRTCAGSFWMRTSNFLAGRLLSIETSAEYLGINKCTSFIYSTCKGLCPKGHSLFSSVMVHGE